MADVYVQVGKMKVLPGKNVSKAHTKGIEKVMKAAVTKALGKASGVTAKGSGKPKYTLDALLIALAVDTKKKKTSCEFDLTLYDAAKGQKAAGARKSAEVAGVAKAQLDKCVAKAMDLAVAAAAGHVKAAASGVIGVVISVYAKNAKPLQEAATKALMMKIAKAEVGKLKGVSVVTKSAKHRLTLKVDSVKIDSAASTTECAMRAGVGPPDKVAMRWFTASAKATGTASTKQAEALIDTLVKATIKDAKAHLN